VQSNIVKDQKGIASGDEVPAEKWLVAYRNPASKRQPRGSIFMRQFYAPGYYEAYDTVLTHAEKMNLEVIWFREKRSCEPFLNRDFPELEVICRYCNKKFNHVEPVPCSHEGCGAEFCSMACMSEHKTMQHKD
jgi:hypothetical protein